MSNWAHVAGIIRIDDLRFDEKNIPDFDKLFGKELNYNSSEDDWDEADKYPEKFMPLGSEGSLQKSVWINPKRSDMAAYTVSIFGDLRDHSDPNKIVKWFKEICEKLFVRQAAINVWNEQNGTANWIYETDDD